MSNQVNDHLVLLCGKSSAGKSASLMGIENPEGVMYLNCEAGKKLPFKSKFKEYTITDPMQVYEALDVAETKPDVHTIVIDSLTYLLDMYESTYVLNSTNTMKAWGDFAQYMKVLMSQKVAASTKNIIFTAHVADQLNEQEMVMETKVPVKGSLKNNGIESWFSCIISAKKIKVSQLEGSSSPMLNITEDDEELGYKYVFQTRLTKDTVGERLRSPLGMWDRKETFIDNNMQSVIDRLREFYV